MKWVIAPLLTLLLLAGTGCMLSFAALGWPPPVAVDEPDPTLIAEGIRIYRANYCGTCHILSAANTRGTFGPEHDSAGLLAERYLALDSYKGTATTAAEYLRESILNPGVFYTPGYEATSHHMPAFGHLPEADIDALVYMLLHQRQPLG